jgi:hypothetical protein
MILRDYLIENDEDYEIKFKKLQKTPSKDVANYYTKEIKPKEDKIRKNIDKKFMNYAAKYIKKIGKDRHWSDVTGVSIFLIKQGKKQLPTKIPKDFPVWLQKESCKIWKKQLDVEYYLHWKNPKRRIKTITEMIKLFDCKIPTNVSSRTRSKSKSKIRKGPQESATLYKEGTKKIGNDGNIWIIKINKNKVKRWVKITKK